MDDPDKPRKRHKSSHVPSSSALSPTPTTTLSMPTTAQHPPYPLAAFLWPARQHSSRWLLLPPILMLAFLFRWSAGLWSYSGQGQPPMFGDFEAQRHWMELTTGLPITDWYWHDAQWWGLDYPPLTAYHSWLCGKIGSLLEPAWFELDGSRGAEGPGLKLFMRSTVVASEYIVYVPAVVFYVRRMARMQRRSTWESCVVLMAILMQPATILIDHVHFQYNTVMLGFTGASMACLLSYRYLWTAVLFVCALCFKQMALFYAPVIFAYLLGSCLFPRLHLQRLIGISAVTVAAFVAIFAPLILGSWIAGWPSTGIDPEAQLILIDELESWLNRMPVLGSLFDLLPKSDLITSPLIQMIQVIRRVFPFARGLYEDKVANVWCALNVVIKLRMLPRALLQRVSAAATLAAVLPGCIIVFLKPHRHLLPWALAVCAWGFFLLGFQVHEKNILLPLLPTTLLLASNGGMQPEIRSWVGFANILGSWTLFPLLKRVGLKTPYAVLTLLWAFLLGLPPTALITYWTGGGKDGVKYLSMTSKIIHIGFYTAMLVWHVCEATLDPPASKPDLWVVTNVCIGAAGFVVCYLWSLWNLVELSGVWQPDNKLVRATKKDM